jgi:hypothetical protein
MKYLLAAIAMLLLGGGLINAAQSPVGERPKWAQGDTWTYNDPVTHQFKYTVLAVAPNHYDVERIIDGSERSVITVDHDLYQTGNILIQFQWPLSQGATWKRVLTGQAPDGTAGQWEITSVVEAYETVVTPAGSFEAFRINNHHCNTKAYSCGDFLMWYAPSAKFYVKISWGTLYWPQFYKGKSRELTSYQVH